MLGSGKVCRISWRLEVVVVTAVVVLVVTVVVVVVVVVVVIVVGAGWRLPTDLIEQQ